MNESVETTDGLARTFAQERRTRVLRVGDDDKPERERVGDFIVLVDEFGTVPVAGARPKSQRSQYRELVMRAARTGWGVVSWCDPTDGRSLDAVEQGLRRALKNLQQWPGGDARVGVDAHDPRHYAGMTIVRSSGGTRVGIRRPEKMQAPPPEQAGE